MSNEKVDWVAALLRSVMRVRFPQTTAPLAAFMPFFRAPFGTRRFGTRRDIMYIIVSFSVVEMAVGYDSWRDFSTFFDPPASAAALVFHLHSIYGKRDQLS